MTTILKLPSSKHVIVVLVMLVKVPISMLVCSANLVIGFCVEMTLVSFVNVVVIVVSKIYETNLRISHVLVLVTLKQCR